MNSLFKPYLPVDEEGFVTIANSNDILNKEYALAPLIRCIKKAEVRSEVLQNEEIIVLTDDEDEDESFSNHEGSSATCSHHDELSNDFDWYSASSQMGNQSQHSQQNIVETVSIDSPPPQPYHKNTPSLSSLDSYDLNMDTTNSLVTDRNGESAQHSDIRMEKPSSPSGELRSTSETMKASPDLNGGNNRSLSTLDESIFNRLVNDINSTHVSIPSNGSASSDIKIAENGESSQINEGENSLEVRQTEEVQSEKLDNEQFNGILTREPVPCTSNGDSSLTTLSSDHNPDAIDETPAAVPHNHVHLKSPADIEPAKNCDNPISSDSPLQNHEETLKTINEVVNNDLKNHEKTNESSNVQTKETPTKVTTASSPIPQTNDVEMESNKENESAETVPANVSMEFVPAAESTASVINETSLLSKSEQDVLFKDRDAVVIFNDLWSNGPTAESPKPEENMSPRDDSPVTFLSANGIDPNFRLKTYTRRPRRLVETKTISTQTSRYSLSGCPSPITTIEENKSSKKDKYLLTEKDDDELFLRDIFNTTELPARSGGSPRIRSPMYLASTPTPSTSTPAPAPIASTSIATPNVTENVQSFASANTSEMGLAEVSQPVKRKRGRPRKYPLPEPGTTPIVPKPPKAPPKPRKPRQPKPPPNPDEEVVFEKRVLRERKPKQKPPEPEPVKVTREKAPAEKPKRSRRRNTIKMTIDAIFNTQSPQLRAIQARRISQILGIPEIKIATILKRRNYNKSINASRNINSDSSNMNESSMLQTFMNRSNGQMANSTATTNEMSSQQNTPSTILARKTYIKPNILSSFSSFSSALRRISFSSRRMSFHTRRISFSASKRPIRPNRTTSPRKSHSVQKYTAIDIFDTSKKRGRKKGQKDTVPRKRGRKPKNQQNITATESTNPIIEVGDKVNNQTIELVDLTNDLSPMELDTTNEMHDQFANIHTALSSTQHIHNVSEPNSSLPQIKRRSFLSEDTETDITNEFTTDPESTVEDTDDSHTRKSKRCRKRPKILDL